VADERHLWLAAAACLAASALNPNGFRVIQVLFLYRASGIQSNNLEWQRPIFWDPGIYSFLLFGTPVALVAAWRRGRAVDWLPLSGFAAISLTAVRNFIFPGLVGPVLIGSYGPRWRWLPPAAVCLMAAALVGFDVQPAIASGNTFALRAADWQLPSGAAGF